MRKQMLHMLIIFKLSGFYTTTTFLHQGHTAVITNCIVPFGLKGNLPSGSWKCSAFGNRRKSFSIRLSHSLWTNKINVSLSLKADALTRPVNFESKNSHDSISLPEFISTRWNASFSQTNQLCNNVGIFAFSFVIIIIKWKMPIWMSDGVTFAAGAAREQSPEKCILVENEGLERLVRRQTGLSKFGRTTVSCQKPLRKIIIISSCWHGYAPTFYK